MSGELLSSSSSTAGWLSDRDPRLRILAALGFALVVVNLHHPPILLLALGGAAALAMAAGIEPRQLARRLLLLEGFMLVLLLFLPFSVPGETLFQLGPFMASQEGMNHALLILFRANAVVISLLALLGTLEPVVLGHALSRLGVPDKLVHLFLFTVRYIDVVHREYQRLRQAMRARAFVPRSDLHTWRTLGWLTGMLLVRSLERSRRILAAMKCRGFDGRLYLLGRYHWQAMDSYFGVIAASLLLGLLLLEHQS
jgi:cobalt/nickel transport system permease protein